MKEGSSEPGPASQDRAVRVGVRGPPQEGFGSLQGLSLRDSFGEAKAAVCCRSNRHTRASGSVARDKTKRGAYSTPLTHTQQAGLDRNDEYILSATR